MIDDLIFRIERAIDPETAGDYDAEALRRMLSEMANELTVAEANAKDVERLQPEHDRLRAEVEALRQWVDDLKHERIVLQKIAARRAHSLEAAGFHADCTPDEVRAAIDAAKGGE